MKYYPDNFAGRVLLVVCVEPGVKQKQIYENSAVPEELKRLIRSTITIDEKTWFLRALEMTAPEQKDNLQTVNACLEETYPDAREFDGIIIGGSPHMLTEESGAWIGRLENFIQNIKKENIPLLGICFGHQIIAQALGGKMSRHQKGEFGICEVSLTQEGKKDSLFQGFDQSFQVLMAHREIVSVLPPEAVELAYNKVCANQAYKIGEHIRGIQFHPEYNRDLLLAFWHSEKEKMGKEGYTEEWAQANLKDTPHMKNIFRNFKKYFIQV